MSLALANPALFWTGLGLVSVPVLIHLFFRRRHRVVRWAAMDFLLAALRKQKRRVEIENLILLLLRCVGILLLALALARPQVATAALNPFGAGARAVVVVLDTSASMAAQQTGRSALDRAREDAGRLLAELPSDSRVTLVVTRDESSGGQPRALLENATPDEARARLGYVRHGFGPNHMGRVFRLAAEKLAALRGRPLVVLLTDLQKTDWDAGAREDVRRAFQELPRDADGEASPVAIIDIGGDEVGNVVLEELRVDAARRAFAGELLALDVRVRNYSDTAARGTLSLYVARADGEWEKAQGIDLTAVPPHGRPYDPPSFHTMLPPDSEGPARFRVVFTPAAGTEDRLEVDSERRLALRVRPPVRILPIWSYTKSLDILRDVSVTLKVIDLAAAIQVPDLAQTDLSAFDVLLWADAESHVLTEAEARKIEAFVRRGGGLLAYLGFGAHPDAINRFFFKDKGEGLFPMMLQEEDPEAGVKAMWRNEENPVEIDLGRERSDAFPLAAKTTQEHPLFRETLKWAFSPEIQAYRRVKWPDESLRDRVVARYTNGDPAVIEHAYGAGRVVVVTTTPDERGFLLNGSVLPVAVFFNAAHFLVPDDVSRLNLEVGGAVRIPLPGHAREVVVVPPDEAGGTRREPVEEQPEFVLGETPAPGFYRVTLKGVTAGTTARAVEESFDVAVNVNPVEGDLRRVLPNELRASFPDANLHFAGDVEGVVPRSAAAGEDEMSRSLLGAVVAILFLELLLAWRFGRRRRAAA